MDKDLRIEFKFKNAVLLQRLREKFGEEVTGKEMAERIGCSYGQLSGLLNLIYGPFTPEGGRSGTKIDGITYSRLAMKIANFLQVLEPADIFPLSLYSLKLPKKYYKDFASVQILSLQEAAEQKLLPPVGTYEDDVDAPMLADDIRNALTSLTEREAMVIRMRFGLDGDETPLEEVGKVLGVSRERVRQIEKKALKRMRHPKISESLKTYIKKEN